MSMSRQPLWDIPILIHPQVLRVIEKHKPDISFDFQEHLLGGVSTGFSAINRSNVS